MKISEKKTAGRVYTPEFCGNAFGRIRAVIFDMDGTLLDSERLSERAWDAAAREVGQRVSHEIFLKMVGHRSADCFRILQEACGAKLSETQIIASAQNHYSRLVAAGVPLMAGAREMFDFARSRAWKIGLATSTRRVRAQEKLERSGLWKFIDAATCGDEVRVGKPDPEIYARTAEKLGVPARECLAIEDSPTGFRSAFSAGCVSVIVPDLVEPTPEALRDAAGIFSSLSELRGFLENHFSAGA